MPQPAARILVVEDEDAIRAPVAAALRDAGFVVRAVPDGSGFPALLPAFRPDLTILDVMLPGRDGVALARDVRAYGDAAVLVLTARDALADRLRGFEAGADDYLVKPFALEELVARVRALLRRLGRAPVVLEVGDLVVDPTAGVACRAGRPLELTATELRLLTYFAENRGRTLSKGQLLGAVWGYLDYDPNLVEVHVSALRRKIEQYGPRLLHTVRGVGYALRSGTTS